VAPETVDLTVVVPTYREVENLESLVDRVFQAVTAAGITAEMIVVDDDSRDGTQVKCEGLARRYDLRLITRKGERGLATAVLAGFRAGRGRYLLCMDADLSHPPEAIPQMVQALSKGADFVIGSRYVAGGGVEKGWGLYRYLNSKLATMLARPLTPVSDPLGGYFALPRGVFLRAVEPAPLGYKIALELLVRSRPEKITEIPIYFQDRKFGQSKLSLRVQLQYLRHLRRLHLFKYPFLSQLGQFLFVGVFGLVVDTTVYYALQLIAGLDHLLARPVSFLCAATNNWFLNRRYTFVYGREDAPGGQWVSYILVMLVGLVVNVGTYALLTTQTQVFSQRRLAALLIGIALGTAGNFLAARWYVFRRRVNGRT
jgi:dolichol-phosphate mannosyltransferase